MKKIRVLSLVIMVLSMIAAQVHAQQQCTPAKAEHFLDSVNWLGGLKLKPHPSIDIMQMAMQYHKNKALWDKAFAFLRDHNLDSLAPGKYPIDGDLVFATVTDGPTKDMADSKWEFHKKYVDIQLVAKGEEKMGQTPVANINVTDPYSDAKDIGHGTFDGGNYYVVKPGVFLVFFPTEGHRPSLKVNGCNQDKKIVIKVKAN